MWKLGDFALSRDDSSSHPVLSGGQRGYSVSRAQVRLPGSFSKVVKAREPTPHLSRTSPGLNFSVSEDGGSSLNTCTSVILGIPVKLIDVRIPRADRVAYYVLANCIRRHQIRAQESMSVQHPTLPVSDEIIGIIPDTKALIEIQSLELETIIIGQN
ncbi:predicted protein [Aspergillus nidulans FGSC A4]|uniref:Uncharacterized protein n=1 Tax=Emericella nidulans (strain FGSC A4 / ATCC 38163 / CBS 112.46 / NRRL 194 / M139) TaxID=227321 RepID=Q5BBV2_EMENI|nr:hypothetical protein [Aspergillus nidulans FGSC A4]EAA63879.1 predicted protein [Aspergillus nidulans FGSC A4]CBF85936.1 TPA: conserved hypothetical protein [Aspergillus nidulans FGSC A4]|eukprot:XP_659582.1 predicted protein [Aspergillus nidulans FGSC A4]